MCGCGTVDHGQRRSSCRSGHGSSGPVHSGNPDDHLPVVTPSSLRRQK
jgi:hypothetical protein